jgi:hypothetical protein
MKSVIHACFDSKEAVMHAVESLLRHGVSAQDVTLIVPHSQSAQEPDSLASLPVSSEVVTAPKHDASSIVVGGEEGAGVGFGLGLLTAMCIPGIGLIGGSGAIIISLVAAGTAIGGVSGGMYGYLVQRDTPHSAALAMAEHITSGGATLSVTTPDSLDEDAIVRIVEGAGGRVIRSDRT